MLEWVDGRTMSNEALGAAGHADADRGDAPHAPRRPAVPRRLRHVPAHRALPCPRRRARHPDPGGLSRAPPGDPPDRGRPRRPSAADRPLPQRPAGRELPRRRRAAVDRRLRVQRQQRPDLRARQHVPGARLRRRPGARAVRGLLRRGLPRPARPDAAPDDHVRRRLDAVGGDPGAHLDRSTTTSGAGPRSAGRERRPRSMGRTSRAGSPPSRPEWVSPGCARLPGRRGRRRRSWRAPARRRRRPPARCRPRARRDSRRTRSSRTPSARRRRCAGGR